jgi:hypothetical protein
MWHLEPSHADPAEEWAALSDHEREFYRILVRHLIGKLAVYGLRLPPTTV